MSKTQTLGVTLPVSEWVSLFALAEREDRSPSDYLRLLILREYERVRSGVQTKKS